MKTIIKIIVIILIAYGVYRLVDKQWAQDLLHRIQSIFQLQENTQETPTTQEEIPEITAPEQPLSIASENALVLDYIFEWTEDGWQTRTGQQENAESESEEVQESSETGTLTPKPSQNTSSSHWLTADDYRDLEKLWKNLVE